MNYHSILSTITLSLLFINTPIYAMNFNFLSDLASSVKEQAITIWCGTKDIEEIKNEFYAINENITMSLYTSEKIQQDINKIKTPTTNSNQNLTISNIESLKKSLSTKIKTLGNHITTFKDHIRKYDPSIKNRDSERIENLSKIQNYITITDLENIDIEKLRPYIYKITKITDFRINKTDKKESLEKESLEKSFIEPFDVYITQNSPNTENTNVNIDNTDKKALLNVSTITPNDQKPIPCINTNNTNKPNNSNNDEITNAHIQEAITYQPTDLIKYINEQNWYKIIKICCLQLLWLQHKNTYDNRKLFTDELKTKYKSSLPYMTYEVYKKKNIPEKLECVTSIEYFKISFNNIQCNDEIFKSLKTSFNTQIQDIEKSIKQSKNVIDTKEPKLKQRDIEKIKQTAENIKKSLRKKNKNKQIISIDEWIAYLSALNKCLSVSQDEKEKEELNERIANVNKIIERKKIKENLNATREKIKNDKNTYDKVMLNVAETYLSQLIELKNLTPNTAPIATEIEEKIKEIKPKIAKRIEEKELEPLIDFYIKNTGDYSIAIFNNNIYSDFNQLNSYEPNNLSSKVFDQKEHLKAIENIKYNLKRIEEINEEIKKHSIFINLSFSSFIDKVDELKKLLPTKQLPHKSSLYDELVSALKKMTTNIKTATFLPIMSPMQLEEDLKELIDFFNEYKGIKKEDSNFICAILEEYKKDNYYTKLNSLIKKYENDALLNNNKEELKSDLTALENYKNKYQEAASKNIYSAATTFFKEYLDPIDKAIKKISQQIDVPLPIDQQNSSTLNIIEKKNIEQDTIQNKIPQSTEQNQPENNTIIEKQNDTKVKYFSLTNEQKEVITTLLTPETSLQTEDQKKSDNNITTTDEQKPKEENKKPESNVVATNEQNQQSNLTSIEISQSTEQNKPENNILITNEKSSEQELRKEPVQITIDQSTEQNDSNDTITEDQKQSNNNIPTTDKKKPDQKEPVPIAQPKEQEEPITNVPITNVQDQKKDNIQPVTNVVATNGQNGQKPTSSKEPEPKTPINQSSSWLSYIGSILYSPIGGLRYLFSSFLKLFRIF